MLYNCYKQKLWRFLLIAIIAVSASSCGKKSDYELPPVSQQDHSAMEQWTKKLASCSSTSKQTTIKNEQQSKPVTITDEYREVNNYGMTSLVTCYSNGRKVVKRYKTCPLCRGSKLCPSCKGTRNCSICDGMGGIVTPTYDYIPCTHCNKTGHCPMCNNTGDCSCTKYTDDGTVICGVTVFDAQGQIVENHNSDFKMESPYGRSYSSGSSSASSCAYCKGTGVSSTPTTAQPRTGMVAYYNTEGSDCPYCSWRKSHWHDKCLH